VIVQKVGVIGHFGYLAQQLDESAQQGLPGKQHAAPAWQHSFVPEQQLAAT
jgi:hypothetical protein